MQEIFRKVCCGAVFLSFLSGSLFAEEASFQDIQNSLPSSLELELSPPARPYKSPMIAVCLSGFLPGLGHLYLDEGKQAAMLMSAAGFGALDRVDSKPTSLLSVLEASKVAWSYGAYAAYRDARRFNGSSLYSYKMPEDSFKDLALAPVSWSVMKKPEVWGGTLFFLGLAFTVSYFAYPGQISSKGCSLESSLEPIRAFPVAISEECIFRGLLQSQVSEGWNPTAGLLVSSLAFGAAHIPNAFSLFDRKKDRRRYWQASIPLITLAGTYMGWLTYKNRSLRESVALHAWYDLVLFSLDAFASSEASLENPSFFSLPFTF